MLCCGLLTNAFTEVIEYIEHYGLQPREDRLARVQVQVAWNSRDRLSNQAVFNVCMHSDHHMDSSKAYPELSVRQDAPCYPASYINLISLALRPAAWREAAADLLDGLPEAG
jgi:hypothetical protein